MTPQKSLSLTAIVHTLNEELNLPGCLESLQGWCPYIFIVDSGSTDRSLAIAQEFGAQIARHSFESAAKQWNWALENLSIHTDWIIALDSDHRISPELQKEICSTLSSAPLQIAGYYLPRKHIFRGRWIRHGGYWPKYLLKIFRRSTARADEREADFRFYVQGRTCRFHGPLVEQNEKENSVVFWIQKHLKYIELQAQEEYSRRRNFISGWLIRPSLTGSPDQKTLWWKRLWYRLPLYSRPFLYFGYRYGFRLGFLDGPQGALLHFLQGFWFRLMVDVRLGELLRQERRT